MIVTQSLCDVCAVSYGDVQQLAQRLTSRPRVISLTPPNIDGILEDILTVADGAGVSERGLEVATSLRERLARVDEILSGQPRPRVAAIEWLSPPFCGGLWVPEMIQLAGGQDVLGQAGEKSSRVTWEEVLAARPDVVALIPCGYSLEAIAVEWHALPKPDGWAQLPAVVTGRVYALDANSYYSRPAPRVVDGVELLASLLHPERARMARIAAPDRALLRLAAD
jgi:iron complex transport system substrate-binding protein